MEENLRLECFKGTQKITPRKFYQYTLKVIEAPSGLQQESLLNSAVRRLNKVFNQQGYFAVRYHEFIYTAKEITTEVLTYRSNGNKDAFSYELQLQNHQEVALCESGVYESYLKQLLECHLLQNAKYQRSSRDYLTSLIAESARGTQLLREYHFAVKISETGEVYLSIDTCARFDTQLTVYQQLKACHHQSNKLLLLRDEFVSYNLNTSYPQSGYIHSLRQADCTRESLLAYYRKNYPQAEIQAKIARVPLDDRPIQVRLRSKPKVLSYLSSFLKPVLTTEIVAQKDRTFFFDMQPQIKRPMRRRLQLDVQVLADIGKIAEFADLSFIADPVAIHECHFATVKFALPKLIAGKGCHVLAKESAKQAVFRDNIGYYRAPVLADHKLRIKFVNQTQRIDFPAHQFFVNLMDLALKNTIKASFDRVSLKFCQENEDICLVLIPNKHCQDYDQLKRVCAQKPVPSQMVTLEQAQKILRLDKYASNVAQNIAMGILGKLGGIPYILANMPGIGEHDLFVGLDVGMQDVKLHYPACSVVLDGKGEFLGCYEPKVSQKGEKIDAERLQELFDAVLAAYQQKHQILPQNIIIHRDGFSFQEENDWYEQYFGKRGINYAVLEIRKSGAMRLADLNDDFFNNPPIGTALMRGDEGILVTTQAKKGIGAPQPLHIVKKCGDMDMRMALEQIYCLTKIHTGSLHDLRLPVTTYYADQICKSLAYLPKGQFLDRLYFL